MLSSFDWSYPAAFVGGGVILGSFTGWGKAIISWLWPGGETKEGGWGLETGLGMSAFLILSGLMLALSIFSTTCLVLFLLTGVVLLAANIRLFREKQNAWSQFFDAGSKVSMAGLFLFVGLGYAGAVGSNWYSQYDDLAAYFPLTKMLLDTGTLYDPFSFRLLGALGGQTALDALIVAFLPWKYVNLLDMGVAFLVVLGLTQEVVKGSDRNARTARVLLVLLVLVFEMPRINIASEYTSTALFMVLFRAFELVACRRISGWRAALLIGGVIAAAATLRAPNLFIMGFLGVGFVIWSCWENRREGWEIMREAFMAGMMLAVLLSPWWVVAYRSGGSFLYPLFRGNHRPDFVLYNQHISWLETLRFVGVFLISYCYVPFFFPVFFLKAGRERRALMVLGGMLLFAGATLVSQITFGLYKDLYRYVAPMGLAFGLYASGIVARQLLAAPVNDVPLFRISRTRLAVIMVTMALLVEGLGFTIRSIGSVLHILWMPKGGYQLSAPPMGALPLARITSDYQAAFSHIPPKEKTLIALDYPFLLDYRAHSIFNVDVAGAASPDPGLPYFRGAKAVREYLLSQGIRYIAHVPFDRSEFLHSLQTEKRSLTGAVPAYRYYATFEIDFFNNVDQLEKSCPVLYESPMIRVIDLQNP